MKRLLTLPIMILAILALIFATVGGQGLVEIDVDKVDIDGTPQVIESNFPNLTLRFTPVNQSGVPISGLTAEDLTLIEDGTPVADLSSFRSFTDADQGISILLMLDASGSMSDNVVELRQAANQLIDFVNLSANDEMGMLLFSVLEDGSSVSLGGAFPNLDDSRETSFTVDGGLLKNLVNRTQIDPEGGTPLYDALYKGARLASEEAKNNRRVVVLMTDGVDSDRVGNVGRGSVVYDQASVLDEVRALNVPIFTIGLGDEIDAAFLQRVANATGGVYQQTPSADQLGEMFTDIVTLLKQKYEISYDSGVVADDGSHTLEVLADTSIGAGSTTVPFTAIYPAIPWIRTVEAANPRQDARPLESYDGLKGRVLIRPDVVAQGDIAEVNYYVNGELVFRAEETPWEFLWDTTSLTPNETHTLTIEALDDEAAPNVGQRTFDSVLVEECSVICQIEAATGLPAWIWLAGIGLLLLLFVLFLLRRRGSEPEPVPAMATMPPTVSAPMTPPAMDYSAPPAPKPLNPTVDINAASGPAIVAGSGRPSPKTEVLQREPAFIAFLIDTGSGREFPLSDGTTIGRAPSNDIVLDDSSISQQHAKVRLENGQLALFDLGSTNGTEVNGQRIVHQTLADGDKVQFGRKAMVFKKV